jgi:hypothetical protein
MNATEAIDKIVKLLGLKFQKESFFRTYLKDGETEITNNLEGDFQVGQTLYVVGESTLSPAPKGEHITREGLVLVVDAESTIYEIKSEIEEAIEEVIEDENEMEGSKAKVKMVEAKDAQGNILESDTFDVGEMVYVVGPDGEKTPAPNGEHQVVLKDSEGNEVKIRIQTEDGKIIQRENVEQMSTEFAEYPWDECMADMMARYGSEETAKKVCGAIKAGNFMKMPGAPEDIEMAKQELVSKVLNTEINQQFESIKESINTLVSVVDSLNGKFKTDISSLKSDFETFKKQPERKPLEKKLDLKDSFDDFRVDFLKQIKK